MAALVPVVVGGGGGEAQVTGDRGKLGRHDGSDQFTTSVDPMISTYTKVSKYINLQWQCP